MSNNIKSFKDMVDFGWENYMERVAITERRITEKGYKDYLYSDLKENIQDLATALIEKYHLQGKKVAVIGENSYQWIVSYLAVTTAVGIVVPLDKELPANEIQNLIVRSKAEAIIYAPKKAECIAEIRDKVPTIKHFIEMYSEEDENPNDLTLDKIIKEGRELRAAGNQVYESIKIDPREFKILLFTSGTTAAAKGVMLCHGNVIGNLDGARDYLPLTKEDKLISILPIHHTYELTGTYMFALYNGASVGVCQGLKYISTNMEDYKPTMLVAVPLLLDKLYKKIDKTLIAQGKKELVTKMVKITNGLDKVGIKIKRIMFKQIHQKLGGRLKYVLTGSAPIDANLIKAYEGLGIAVLQGFGLTETAPLICGTPLSNRKVGTVGIASKGMKVKLDNVNDDGIGEIITKGTNLMLGYYEAPELTAECVIDGWFHTGDLAYLDKENNLVVCGRAKNLIVTKNGKKIFPEELEFLVNEIPEVKESLVYSKENEQDATDPEVAVIVSLDEEYIKEKYGKDRPSNENLEEKIWKDIKDINRTLVPYKAMKNIKIKDGEFEKTTTMKIKRFIEIKKNK
ncbi:MAG: AMP-binding protein [Clostridia bacterium]